MSNSPLFGQSSETTRMSWSSVTVSITIHALVIAAIALIPFAPDQTLSEMPPRVSAVRLIAPRMQTATKPVMISRASDQKRFKAPVPVERPRRFVPPPTRQVTPAPIPPVELMAANIPATSQAPTAIKRELPALAKIASPEPKAPPREVKTGGFGDPNGVPATGSTGKGLTLAKLGSFDLPQGAGTGGARGTGVVVGGFGTQESAGTSSRGAQGGVVRSAGFVEKDKPTVAHSEAAKTAPPALTPVEILSKPKPAYSEVARAKKLEGEVTLEVLFGANGEIRVLRLVQGLGSGLDQNAEVAAAQIRFRPGMRDGRPVDMKGIVRIVFQLL